MGEKDALRHLAEVTATALMFADEHVFIDTSKEAFLLGGGTRTVVHWPWQDDFSAARNFALQVAQEHGADWALTVDSDERLSGDPSAVRELLESSHADVIRCPSATAGYLKERLVRLPTVCRWVGPNHEYLSGGRLVVDAPMEVLSFSETARAAGHLDEKWRRNLRTLIPFAAKNPSPRWHYYIARAHWGLGHHEEALHRYELCAATSRWDEEAGWARYEGASILTSIGRHEEAVRWAGLGMARCPHMAELAWIAGVACTKLGRRKHARHWADVARLFREGTEAEMSRVGFRNRKGLTFGPDEVARAATK